MENFGKEFLHRYRVEILFSLLKENPGLLAEKNRRHGIGSPKAGI